MVSNKPAEGVLVVVVLLSTVHCNSVYRERQGQSYYMSTGGFSFLLQEFWFLGMSENKHATVSNAKSNYVALF